MVEHPVKSKPMWDWVRRKYGMTKAYVRNHPRRAAAALGIPASVLLGAVAVKHRKKRRVVSSAQQRKADAKVAARKSPGRVSAVVIHLGPKKDSPIRSVYFDAEQVPTIIRTWAKQNKIALHLKETTQNAYRKLYWYGVGNHDQAYFQLDAKQADNGKFVVCIVESKHPDYTVEEDRQKRFAAEPLDQFFKRYPKLLQEARTVFRRRHAAN